MSTAASQSRNGEVEGGGTVAAFGKEELPRSGFWMLVSGYWINNLLSVVTSR